MEVMSGIIGLAMLIMGVAAAMLAERVARRRREADLLRLINGDSSEVVGSQ